MILPCSTFWQAGVTHDSHLYLPTLNGIPMPLAVKADTEGWVDVFVMRGDLVDRDGFGRPKVERLFGRVRLMPAPEFIGPMAAPRYPIHGQGLPRPRISIPAAAHAAAGRESAMPGMRQRDRNLSGSSGRSALAGDRRTRGSASHNLFGLARA